MFNQEEELKTKTARANKLNALINVDKRENEIVITEPDEDDEQPEKKQKSMNDEWATLTLVIIYDNIITKERSEVL